MALIQCPECGKKLSTAALSCPHCGYPLKKEEPIQYETITAKIRCWGRDPKALNGRLNQYTSQGWEIVSTVEDRWEGGYLSPVYNVVLRRQKRN